MPPLANSHVSIVPSTPFPVVPRMYYAKEKERTTKLVPTAKVRLMLRPRLNIWVWAPREKRKLHCSFMASHIEYLIANKKKVLWQDETDTTD
jgi:hypothetical protein